MYVYNFIVRYERALLKSSSFSTDCSLSLKKIFEPDSRRELYAVEFQTRGHQKGELWA